MNVVRWDIGTSSPVSPGDSLPEPPEIPPGGVVIVGGRAPIWWFGRALHLLHGSAAAVAAVFDPKLGGAVIVASHQPGLKEGDVIPYEW